MWKKLILKINIIFEIIELKFINLNREFRIRKLII